LYAKAIFQTVRVSKEGIMCEKEDILAKKCLAKSDSGKTIVPSRIEHSTPSAYRLGQRANGEYVLQGYFFWQDEWKDMETIKLP